MTLQDRHGVLAKYNLVWLCQFLHHQQTLSSLSCPTGNNHCSVGTWAIWQSTKHSELGTLIVALHAYYVLVRNMWRDIPVDALYYNVCSMLHRTPLLSPNPGKQHWLHWRRTSSHSEPGTSTGITAFTKITSGDIRDWTTQERRHCWWLETATGLCSVIMSLCKVHCETFKYFSYSDQGSGLSTCKSISAKVTMHHTEH